MQSLILSNLSKRIKPTAEKLGLQKLSEMMTARYEIKVFANSILQNRKEITLKGIKAAHIRGPYILPHFTAYKEAIAIRS